MSREFKSYALATIGGGLLLCLFLIVACANSGADIGAATFEEVFGSLATIPADIPGRLQALNAEIIEPSPGGPVEYQMAPDADTLPEHRPLLVKSIDRDGDGKDMDSDLYVIDWNANGVVDAIVAYADTDKDQDVDEMISFFKKGTTLSAWFARDVSDDNRLWHLTDYIYTQSRDEFLTDFNGDELFVHYEYSPKEKAWRHTFEDPFFFYDMNRDGFSDLTVRYSTNDGKLSNLRYSAGVSGGANANTSHLFNFSLSMIPTHNIGKEDDVPSSALIPNSAQKFLPFLSWEEGISRLDSIIVSDVELVWVEDDNNHCGATPSRWEGVINIASAAFPFQVGGCGYYKEIYNRRSEIIRQNRDPIGLYFSSFDGKLHLHRARKSGLKVDFDQDGIADMTYEYFDGDSDGHMDSMKVDTDVDGLPELTLNFSATNTPWNGYSDWQRLQELYQQYLSIELTRSEALIPVFKACVRQQLNQPSYIELAEVYYYNSLPTYGGSLKFGERMKDSNQTRRFYFDVIRDRYFSTLYSLLSTSARAQALQLYANRSDQALIDLLALHCGP